MSTIKSSSEHLTLNADGASKDIKFQSNGVEKASLSDAGLLTTSGGASLDGAVTINSSNADVDFKVGCETGADNVDTEDYALWVEGSTGNVVIGSDTNTDEAVNLLVTRSGLTTMEVYASEDSSARDAMLRLHTRSTGAQCRIRFLDGSGAGTTAGEIYYNHDGDTMYFHTAGTQRAQLNSNGLCFNTDTAAANALDDYEEGSWTPGFLNGTPTYTTVYARAGKYVKIGTMCFVWMELYMGSISFSDSTAILEIGTLPFQGAGHGNTFGMQFGGTVQLNNMYTNGSTYNDQGIGSGVMTLEPYIAASGTSFKIAVSPHNNAARSFLRNAAFHNGSGFVVGFCYQTT